jgi:hypothetical protein
MIQRRLAGATLASLVAVAVTQTAPVAAAAPQLQHVRGTIARVTGSSMFVTTDRGTVDVALGSSTGVLEAVAASRSDIKPSSFIGVTNVPGAEDARAVGVFLLPDALRSQAGSVAWDYPAAGSGSRMTNGSVVPSSRMTNGTVQASSRMTNGTVQASSRMTNGTVSAASNNGPLTLTLNYKGGSTLVTIPADTPVVRLVPSTRAALRPGAHVFVFAKVASGGVTAANIIVGVHGVVPPM